ncbi:hypothetical protein C5B91_03605 [Haloferax sp. Atlit-10N]|uniref:Uncharacterized protein n=1 Tax=Haloferax prahovense (strain DSM 18310 / JCM 13924 / TL6) TaxID=1227461 RepID=M0GJI8_HALPT|nr:MULTISPECIES: hypothetical protein [Haloferax]ELZ72380.1 hypothetical protein C457_05364 [Haloferax prahovense DSM 18310]RDZ46764.1 hypothetical protein C5B87_03605 [Haloferax sp. Atlit-16N]RDZ60596.1 hypothetical protein C5B91_03605 [Haloferax sp. Atlit-10N]
MNRTSGVSFARDAAVATAVLAGLYGLGYGIQFQPFQLPTYLLIVGFDALEVAFGSAGAGYDLRFAAYLVGLGVVAAGVSRVVRGKSKTAGLAWWRVGVASALAVVGVISLLFALLVLVNGVQFTPVLVTGGAGIALLALAAWVGDLVRVDVRPAR